MRRIWVGGSPCSGKSTLAERLASELELAAYHVDDYFYDHAKRASLNSTLKRITGWSTEQIFLRDVDEMLADFITLGYEEFPFVLDDLRQAPCKRGGIIEGCALLPECVDQVKQKGDTVLYLVASEAFQRFHYARRPWIKSILLETSRPKQAWDNWQKRDAQYAEFIKREARKYAFPVITVEEGKSLDDIYDAAKAYL